MKKKALVARVADLEGHVERLQNFIYGEKHMTFDHAEKQMGLVAIVEELMRHCGLHAQWVQRMGEPGPMQHFHELIQVDHPNESSPLPPLPQR